MPKRSFDGLQFQGFSSPNYTMVPDELFDELLAVLSGAELKVLLYIIRRTFGFKRDSDRISLSQMTNGITTRDGRVLDRGVGLSKPTLLQALRSLEDQNIIETERQRSEDKGDEPTVYKLRFALTPRGQKTLPPVVKKLYQGGGQESLPGPWSKNFTTQETGNQETVEQETAISNYSKGPHSTILDSRVSEEGRPSPIAARSDQTISETPAPAPALDRNRSRRSQSAGHAGLTAIGQILAQTPPQYAVPETAALSKTQKRTTATTPLPEVADLPEQIEALISLFSDELGDSQHVRSNLTQALHLYHASGLPESTFAQHLYEAKRRARTATRVRKRAATGSGAINRMPYFFAVLRDLVGLKDAEAEEPAELPATDMPQPGSAPVASEQPSREPLHQEWVAEAPVEEEDGESEAEGELQPGIAGIWQAVLERMREQVSSATYQTWLTDTHLAALDETRAVIGAPTQLAAEWVSKRYGGLMEAALQEVTGKSVTIEYIVASAEGEPVTLSPLLSEGLVGPQRRARAGGTGAGRRTHQPPN